MTVFHGDNIGLDLYPPGSPKNGPRIRRFTSLQDGTKIRRERNGTGLGTVVIPGDSDDAEAIDPTLLHYVRAERLGSPVALALSSAADDQVDTAAAHGLQVGDKIEFISLTGGAGLSTTPTYYVAAVPSSTSLKVATTKANALAGTAVNFTTDITAGSIRKLTTLAGVFLYQGKYSALTRNGQRPLVLFGPGTLAYLAREIMWSHTYVGAAGALSAVSGGQDPFDDLWRLYLQGLSLGATADTLGAIFWRTLAEGLSYQDGAYTHRHGDGTTHTDTHDDDKLETAIPEATLTFDADNDSAGNVWSSPAGDITAQVATDDLLDVAMRLWQAGLEVLMDPDTFEVDAYEAGTLGVDRTGASWGTDVVRFVDSTDGTVSTGNILTTAERALAADVRRSTILAGGQDVYGTATDPAATIPWHGGLRSDVAKVNALETVAGVQIQARTDTGDVPRIRVRVGDDPANGLYRLGPGCHADIYDLVTVHSGTGKWDWNNASLEMSAIEWQYRKSDGEWDPWVEFGSTFAPLEQALSFRGGSGKCSCGPTLRLCDPGSTASCADLTDADLTSATATNGDAEDPDGGQWSGGAYRTPHRHGGSRCYGSLGELDSTIVYTFDSAQVFSKGVRYVIDVWSQRHSYVSSSIKFGVDGGDEDTTTDQSIIEVRTGVDGGNWAHSRFCWTPTADRTGVRFSWNEVQGDLSSDPDQGTRLLLDDLTLSTTEATDPLPGISNKAARCDHKHRHNDLLGREVPDAHPASAISVADTKGNFVEDNVEAVLAELAERDSGPGSIGGFVAAALSNPPTQAEIETAIGSTATAGSVYGLQDSGTEKRYLALGDGVTWHIVPLVTPIQPAATVELTDAPAGGWGESASRAVYYNGKTYFAYVRGDNGNVEIRYYDHSAGTVSSATVMHSALGADTHNGPTLVVRTSDHRIHVVYCAHVGSALYQWVSTNPEDISAGTETNLDSQLGASVYTYASILEIDSGLFISARTTPNGAGHQWGYSVSIDAGTTWSAMVTYLQEPGRHAYPVLAKTGDDRIDVMAKDGNADESAVSIMHFWFDGSDWHDTEGTALTLPISTSNATIVWDGDDGDAGGHEDVTRDAAGNPCVAFTIQSTDDYYVARWNGSSWVSTMLAGDADFGVGGIRFDRQNANIVYALRLVSGVNELFEYTTLDGGVTYTQRQLTSGSSGRNLYPISPYDHPSDLPVIWLNGTFTDYLHFSLGITGFGTGAADADEANAQRIVVLDDTELGEAVLRRNSDGAWQISRDDGSTWESLGGSGSVFTVDAGTPDYSSFPTVGVTSKWGIATGGNPYFNSAGVTSGDEAALMRDADTGAYFLRPYSF